MGSENSRLEVSLSSPGVFHEEHATAEATKHLSKRPRSPDIDLRREKSRLEWRIFFIWLRQLCVPQQPIKNISLRVKKNHKGSVDSDASQPLRVERPRFIHKSQLKTRPKKSLQIVYLDPLGGRGGEEKSFPHITQMPIKSKTERRKDRM